MKKRYFSLLLFAAVCITACQKDVELATAPGAPTVDNNTMESIAASPPQQHINADTFKYLRLQLAKDSINTDEVLILFQHGAKTSYSPTEDAGKLQGFGMVSLASFSSDNIALAINNEPLPKPGVTIPLKVSSATNGVYYLNLKTINAIPAIYDIWLMDKFNKDSLDFRHNPTYAFNLNLTDTTTYGSNRFSLVIRENKANGVHLLSFTAGKTNGGTQLKWLTENEENYTGFTVERSTDGGTTYASLTSLASSGIKSYGYLDAAPAKGSDQYRLKTTDLNGTVTYSQAFTLQY